MDDKEIHTKAAIVTIHSFPWVKASCIIGAIGVVLMVVFELRRKDGAAPPLASIPSQESKKAPESESPEQTDKSKSQDDHHSDDGKKSELNSQHKQQEGPGSSSERPGSDLPQLPPHLKTFAEIESTLYQFTCPQCGKTVQKTGKWLADHRKLEFPCKYEIDIRAYRDSIRAELEQARSRR